MIYCFAVETRHALSLPAILDLFPNKARTNNMNKAIKRITQDKKWSILQSYRRKDFFNFHFILRYLY